MIKILLLLIFLSSISLDKGKTPIETFKKTSAKVFKETLEKIIKEKVKK